MTLKHIHHTNQWFKDIFFLTLCACFFYSLWLGSYALFTPDEARYSEVAREMIANHDYITPRVNGVAFLDKPVLYYWFQVTAIHLFGIKEWALRFFPAFFGVLGCVLTYVSGRYLFDRRTGLVSAVILATTPLYFSAAHYANLDLEVAFFISSSLLSFLVAMQMEGKKRKYILLSSYFFAACAFLTKGLIGLAFPMLIVGCWILLLWRFHVLKKMNLILGLALFSMIVLPWYILVQRANPEFLHFFFVTQQVTRFLSHAEFNNQTPFWFYLPVVVIGFFPWSLYLAAVFVDAIKKIRLGEYNQIKLFLLLWVVIVFAFFSVPKSKIITYILPVFPPLSLLVGHFIAEQWQKYASLKKYFIAFFAFSVCYALLLLLLPIFVELPHQFYLYLYCIVATLFISAIIAFYHRNSFHFSYLFLISFVCNLFFLTAFIAGAEHLNQNSTKSLVIDLKKIIKPQDEIAAYFKFYYDVPLYLGRTMTIVNTWDSPDINKKDNWARELWYGMSFQNTESFLINEKIFWERWYSHRRMFVFLNQNYFHQFKAQAKSYFFIAQQNDIILLSNQLSS